MKSRLPLWAALFCAAVLLVPIAISPIRGDGPRSDRSNVQSEELRWKLKAGQNFRIELDQDMKQTFDMGGSEQEMPMKFTMFMSWTVDEATETEFQVTQIIDRIKMSMSLPGMGDVSFDSDSEEPPSGFAEQFASSMQPLVGLKIAQTLNSRGQTVKCEIDPAALEGLKNAGMGGQFASEEMLKNMVSQSACVLPESAIDKGASWDDQFSVDNQMGKMITSAKYTYEGKETLDGKSLEKISVNSSVNIEPAADAPVEVEIAKQDNKGTVYFDNDAGYVSSATMTQSMTMNVTTMGQEINVITTGTVTFSMKPDDGSGKEEPKAEKTDDKVGEKVKETATKDK